MTPTSLSITHTTSLRQLQVFLYHNGNAKLHGKLNEDRSYTLYVKKGGGSGAGYTFQCPKDYRQMNARAAILRVILNYLKNPAMQEEFESHFSEFEEFLNSKFPQMDDLDPKGPSDRVNDLKKYLIAGLPSNIVESPGIQTRHCLYANDVLSKLEPNLAWYLSDDDRK